MNFTQSNLKIVFAGSVGAGKTSSIKAISDIDVIATEEQVSDELKLIKETTTVALDYGQMILDDGSKLHLYGAPGQGRFDFMWDILSHGALGVIVLIDDTSKDPFAEIDTYMEGFKKQLKNKSMVLAITRTDLNKGYSISQYRKHVSQFDATIPVYTIDAREKKQINILVKTLLYRIDPWLN